MEEIIIEKRFGDIAEEYAGLRKSRTVVIQAPYEGTLTYGKGASRGPRAIIDASMNMELFDDELNQDTYKFGIHTAPPLAFSRDASPEDAINKVKGTVSEVLQANKFPVVVGGEHSITVGSVKATREQYPDLSVLSLDAHYDLRDQYKGSKFNHACVTRRVQETNGSSP